MFWNVRLFCPAWLAGWLAGRARCFFAAGIAVAVAVAKMPKAISGRGRPISGEKRAAPTLENTLKTMVTITTL